MRANPAQCPLCSGLQALGQTFGANPAFASSLRYLDLSKNPGLLATDEANVSPQNICPTLCRSMLRIQGQGVFTLWALGVDRLSPLLLQPVCPFFLRLCTVSWPSPMPWCTWTCRGLTVLLTW